MDGGNVELIEIEQLYNVLVDGRCVIVPLGGVVVDEDEEALYRASHSLFVRSGDSSALKRRINSFARHSVEVIVLVERCSGANSSSAREDVDRWLQGHNNFYLKLWQLNGGVVLKDLVERFPFLKRPSLSHNLPHQIFPNLFLSDASSAQHPHLPALGIGAIVNASGIGYRAGHPFQGEVLTIAIDDLPGVEISKYFENVNHFIRKQHAAGTNVLVHCAAGVSRSTTFVLAYMIEEKRYTLREAFRHTHAIRSVVQPNAGFVKQLISYEATILGTNSVAIPPVKSSNSFDEWQATNLAYLCKY